MKRSNPSTFAVNLKRSKGRIIVLICFLLLLYVVLPRLGSFSESFEMVRQANGWYIGLAAVAVVVTYLCAAGTYQALALHLKGVHFRHTLWVQGASAFANRLLPAGLGGLTLNVQYLRKHGHTFSEAVAVAGLNNLLGLTGHLLLLGIVLAIGRSTLTEHVTVPHISAMTWFIAGLVFATAVAVLLAVDTLRIYLVTTLRDIARYISEYQHQWHKLVIAQLSMIGLTSFYIFAFYLCLQAVGVDSSLWQVFIVFTVGTIAGAAIPAPGGLVGTEAGLVGGLVAYGVDPAPALAAVLLYRLLTYWLPLLPGFGLFVALRSKYL